MGDCTIRLLQGRFTPYELSKSGSWGVCVKRVSFLAKIFSLLISAAAVALAAACPEPVLSWYPPCPGTYTVTIAGHVKSGINGAAAHGAFLAGQGPFGEPGASLATQPFTLVYIFDDSMGIESGSFCHDGSMYYSAIKDAPPSSPGKAMLTIGGGSFPFGYGSYGEIKISSYADRFVPRSSCSSGSKADFGVTVSYGNNYAGASYVYATALPALWPEGSLSSSADWWGTISPAVDLDQAASAQHISFVINVMDKDQPSGSRTASGFLTQESLVVQ